MSLTKTQLCNLALSKLGSERLQLSSFDTDTGVIKDQVDLHYQPTLDELTRMHSWNCCKKRMELSPFILRFTLNNNNLTIAQYDLFAEADTFSAPTGVTNFDMTDWQNPKYSLTRNTGAGISYGINLERNNGGNPVGATAGKGYWHLTVNDANEILNNLEDSNASYEKLGAVPVFTNTTISYTGITDVNPNAVVSRPKPDSEFDYQYFIPDDAQRSFYLTNSSETYKFMKPKVDWVIEGNSILTNEAKVYLCYNGSPEPTAMDSLFAQAFITLFAARLAVPMTGDRSLSLSLMEEFNRVIMPEARRVNGTERLDPPTIDSEWLEATYTSNSSYSNSYPPFSQTSYGSFS